MRNPSRAVQIAVSLMCALIIPWPGVVGRGGGAAQAAEIATNQRDRTLSPYFFVPGGDPKTDRLPLKSTSADVSISGVIAHVRVEQVYENEGKRPLEATYVFPASTHAAVFAMRMKIGERVIRAKIEKKAAARKIYEAARAQGKSASLLEQKRPNVFQMSVANIMPGDAIKVDLDYVEALVPDDGVYTFVYPTVVGPRYSKKTALSNPGETWIENPHLGAGQPAPYKWNLKARIQAGVPIARVASPSHKITAHFADASRVDIGVNDPHGGNRDFVLKYRLAGNAVKTGMLLYPGKGKGDSYFLAMMQPPKRVTRSERPAREYIFIVDVSGSMYGFPLRTAKALMHKLLAGLGPRDRFNVMMFSGGNTVLAPKSIPATHANVARALYALDHRHGGGGTVILRALQRALAMPRSRRMSTSFVVITDGYVAVERKAFDLIRNNLGRANLFAFGIGSSVNRYLIEGMARAGMGEPFVVLGPRHAAAKAAKFLRYISSPVLTNIKVHFAGFHAYDVVPSSIPDLFAQRPILVYGKYRGAPTGSIHLTGFGGAGRYATTLHVSHFIAGARHNEALRYLWARHKIKELSDYRSVGSGSRVARQITRLGLEYNLMTRYTSFVAVDSHVRNRHGRLVSVRQPLPMPQGVSNYAVGRYGTIGAGHGGGGTGYGYGASENSGAFRRAFHHHARARAAEHHRRVSAKASMQGGTLTLDEATRSTKKSSQSRRSAVARSVRRRLSRIRHSLRPALSRNPNAGGRLHIELMVRPSGRVSVRVLSSTIRDAAVRRKILHILRRLRFSAFAGRPLRVRFFIRL